MSILFRITICIAGLLLIILAIKSIASRKISEKQSLFWIFSGIAVIIVGIFPSIIILISNIFSVDYAPSIIFSLALVVALYGIFECFQAIAMLKKQVQELAMQLSLVNQENTQLLKISMNTEEENDIQIRSRNEEKDIIYN